MSISTFGFLALLADAALVGWLIGGSTDGSLPAFARGGFRRALVMALLVGAFIVASLFETATTG